MSLKDVSECLGIHEYEASFIQIAYVEEVLRVSLSSFISGWRNESLTFFRT